ncbi:MAG: glutaminase A [Lachnospiraceae bacterium]|nr:glutaminase A [Lachnospiraceae bacterium]
MKQLLEQLLEECRPYTKQGHVATYIPELSKASPDDLGICILKGDGRYYQVGECKKQFTIQSIIKPILLLLALMDNGEEYVRSRVGVEATGKPFDAINVTDQAIDSKHLNPMVNMGAIAMCTLIHGDTYEEKFQRILAFTRVLANNADIDLDESVYRSEKETGNRNWALGFLLKNHDLFRDNVGNVLDCYFKACSIRVNSKDLATIGFVLANRGRLPQVENQMFPIRYARYVNAVLMTCGMYDGSGNFAVDVGIPAKSGVGGGIMAVVPCQMGIGIFSPALDEKGNSFAGIQVLQRLSQKMDLSVF